MVLLASESPRRKALLQQLEIPFAVKSVPVQELEQPPLGCSVSHLPEMNACLKAEAASRLYPEDRVIGADTAIVFEDQLIGKPRDMADARRILRLLAGKTHFVITGIAVIRSGNSPFKFSWSEISEVSFKPFDEAVMERYLSLVEVLDKAGAYAIQEHGELIVSGIKGDMNNIIGLPLEKLQRVLQASALPGSPDFSNI